MKITKKKQKKTPCLGHDLWARIRNFYRLKLYNDVYYKISENMKALQMAHAEVIVEEHLKFGDILQEQEY